MPPLEAAPPGDETSGYEVLGSAPAETVETVGEGWLLTVRLPATSPLFAGHFPGHPILPGVAQLALVTRALHDWRGAGIALAGVRSWKLRQPAGPGDTLAVRLSVRGTDEQDAESVSFVIEKNGETVSRGTVLLGEAAAWR